MKTSQQPLPFRCKPSAASSQRLALRCKPSAASSQRLALRCKPSAASASEQPLALRPEIVDLQQFIQRFGGIQNFLVERNIEMHIRVWSDSSAGRAMAMRVGAGRVRHLTVRMLFIQQLTSTKRVSVHGLKGTENMADIGTKILDAPSIAKLMPRLGMVMMPSMMNGILSLGAKAWKRLAALIFATSVGAGQYSQGECPTENCAARATTVVAVSTTTSYGTSWMSSSLQCMMVIFVVLTVYETMKFVLCGCCRRPKSSIGKANVDASMQSEPMPQGRSVCTMSQCTYSSVRQVTHPKFEWIEGRFDGVWL